MASAISIADGIRRGDDEPRSQPQHHQHDACQHDRRWLAGRCRRTRRPCARPPPAGKATTLKLDADRDRPRRRRSNQARVTSVRRWLHDVAALDLTSRTAKIPDAGRFPFARMPSTAGGSIVTRDVMVRDVFEVEEVFSGRAELTTVRAKIFYRSRTLPDGSSTNSLRRRYETLPAWD